MEIVLALSVSAQLIQMYRHRQFKREVIRCMVLMNDLAIDQENRINKLDK